MTKKMLINSSHPEECRVAVVVDGELDELDVKTGPKEATVGNIYKGVINRVEPSLQAVFVSYSASKNGFLSINDVHPSYFPESFHTSKRRPRIQDVFKKDDHVVVQVVKEERGNKGAALTTNISMAGRYLVLMPGADLYGVSRKIEEEAERRELKEILKQLAPPENMGFIIRTAGLGRTKTELSRDLNYLLRLWKTIEKSMASGPAPCLLHKEHDLVVRAIREHFSNDITEILVDDKEVYKKASNFFRQVMPKYEKLVKHYQEKRPLFNKYQLEEQIEKVYSRKIKLKSGGYIIIEITEAMVTIDVNSGKATREKEVEDTAYVVNMEAATEIARQLRLRDLGGIIVIDFIDMINKKHIQDVERNLKAAMKRDRAKTKVSRMSSLGLLELSRQRLRPSLGEGEFHDCPLCEGTGRLRAPETTSLYAFRKIKAILARGDIREVRATVPSQVADYLLNFMRAELHTLELQHGSKVVILGKSNLPDSQMTVESVKEDEAHATAVTRVIELFEPQAETLELVPEQKILDEPEIKTVEQEAETKAPKKRRRSRKKTKPVDETPLLGEQAGQPMELPLEPEEMSGKSDLDQESEAQPAQAIETETEIPRPEASLVVESNPEPAPNNAQVVEIATAPELEAQSDAAIEDKKEDQILTKKMPRKKATLQDYLPFS